MSSAPDPLALFDPNVPGARVVTIGTFDGVHLGHVALVRRAAERAGELGLPLTALTFDPPPVAVLRPEVFQGTISTIGRRLALLREAGADDVVVIPFSREFAALSAETFVDVLARRAGVRAIIVGEEFALGRGREGTVDTLREIGASRGIVVEAMPRVTLGGEVISSSAIRRAVLRGDAAIVQTLLGRPFRIEGEVIHGAHLGRTIGFPTANVLPPEGQVQLADGIYATFTHLPGAPGARPSMTYIGTRPALNTGRRLIETHLLDFDADLYGQCIAVDFVEHLRTDANFPSVEALIAQLRADEIATRNVLRNVELPLASPVG